MTAASLRAHLEDTDRSAAWLARQLGVNRTSVWRWTRNEEPIPEHHVSRIHELLGVPEPEAA